MTPLLTAIELAAALKMNHHVLLRWTRAGKVTPDLYVGRQPRFDERKVRAELGNAAAAKAGEKWNGLMPTL